MEDKIIELIKLYKGMLISYTKMIDDGMDEVVLLSKKGTLLMLIDDLEKMLGEEKLIDDFKSVTILD